MASLEKEEYDIQSQVHKTIHALEVQQENPKEKTPEELVPKKYHKFLKVFSKKESEHMPLQKPWDHAIDLKDTFKPKKGHIIPLLPAEQEEVTAFLDDQLKKGHICPSKSPKTSPVFFVPKKDGKKRMVQDYHYLNEHTVKNNYPLLLIAQLVDKLQGAKLFTKMDLRWRYNNVRITFGTRRLTGFESGPLILPCFTTFIRLSSSALSLASCLLAPPKPTFIWAEWQISPLFLLMC